MNKTRLEAFSDGVFAIIITIMVLEIKIPHGVDWDVLKPLLPALLSYILSFTYVGIYWGNHHHMVHAVKHVTPSIIWGNMSLLFCLSLIPFATGWMGENHFATNTIILYAVLLLFCGFTYAILQASIEKNNPLAPDLKKAFIKMRRKGFYSVGAYTVAIGLAFINTALSGAIFLLVAIFWLIPDPHVARALSDSHSE